MQERYNLNELAMITSLTTRTLRNHLRQGTLSGEKVDGAWMFTAEDVDAFMAQPAVRKSIRANHSGVVFDFLADTLKPQNRSCVILDFAVSIAEGEKIVRFFCEQASRSSDIELRCLQMRNGPRVILSGGEQQVADILSRYYAV